LIFFLFKKNDGECTPEDNVFLRRRHGLAGMAKASREGGKIMYTPDSLLGNSFGGNGLLNEFL
jgi:hypothetical protein